MGSLPLQIKAASFVFKRKWENIVVLYICIHDIAPRVDRGKKRRTKQGISKNSRKKDTGGIRKKECGISTITGVL